jgi:hypothetical protein
MDTRHPTSTDRRDFLMKAGLGVAAAEALFSDTLSAQSSVARQLTDDEKMSRLAMTCWPQRHLFKSYGRGEPNEETLALRKKYGEITMLDLPKWTKDLFPGIYLNAHRYKGTIALEWENGPMDGIEGTKWLMKEVLAAL